MAQRFPDELFTELRRSRPLFRHQLTPDVAGTGRRDSWVTTKHRHSVRLHRDVDSFTAMDVPFNPPAIAKLEAGIRTRATRMVDHLRAEGGGESIYDEMAISVTARR